MTPFIGGDDDIIDDEDETPLEEDGDGDGVDGVGEPRVSDVAEIFLAVNDSGIVTLTMPLMVVVVVVGLPTGLTPIPPEPCATMPMTPPLPTTEAALLVIVDDFNCCNIVGEMGAVIDADDVDVVTQEELTVELFVVIF